MGSEKKSKITLRGADVSYCMLSSPVPHSYLHSNCCVSLCVCHSSVRLGVLHRPKITRLDFKRSRLTLVVVEDDDQVCVFTLHAVTARGHLSGD